MQKSRIHSIEILACAKLRSGKGDTSPLANTGHHCTFMILHKENLLEMDLLRLMAGSR
jgi:hypothetical protein